MAVPAGVDLLDRPLDGVVEAEAGGQGARRSAVLGHLGHHSASAGGGDTGPGGDTCEQGAVAAGAAEHVAQGGETGEVDLVHVGPEVDVVAEQGGGVVAVDVTADVGQQGGVIHGGPFASVDPESVSHAQGHPSRAQDVLVRVPEAQVRGPGHRGHHLGQPDPRRCPSRHRRRG